MENFYRQLLKRSWHISWKNKWLWLFGFFATFVGGGTFYDTVVRSFTNMSEGRSIFYTLREYSNMGLFSVFSWTKIVELWSTDSAALLLSLFTLLILFLLAVLFIILAIISQAGLISGIVGIDQGKKVNFKSTLSTGIQKFWPVLAINIVMKVILFGLILFLAYLISLIAVKAGIVNYIIYVISLVILLLLGIIVYFLTLYSTAFIVLRDKKIFESIKYAWYIFKNNVLLNLEVGLILFIIQILVGLATILLGLFILSPFILIYLLTIMLGINYGLGLLGAIIVVLLIIVLALIGSWFTTFQIATWSILFEELALKKGKSKLLRVLGKVFKKRKKR